MKVAIFTTDTLHHAYFVRELAHRVPQLQVFCETQAARAPFDTSHRFEEAREDYEQQAWFGGKKLGLADIASTQFVPRLNDPRVVSVLAAAAPDVILVFGTGRLVQPVLAIRPQLTFNLHGGDPEQYRGLDSHLWAIYHRDFAGLVTTLHRVTAEIDAGDIVLRRDVPIQQGMELHELRRFNTEVCVDLALEALSTIEARGNIAGRRQRLQGRYYSFMPTALKEVCCKRFAAYSASLKHVASAT